MKITGFFDGGVVKPHEIGEGEITFDLVSQRDVLNVLIQSAPAHLKVRLLVEEKGAKFLLGQGLLVSQDGEAFAAIPLEKVQEGTLVATLPTAEGDVRLATRYPYGRDRLDRLLGDTRQATHARVRFLRDRHRQVPIFDFGEDAAHKWQHYFVAGEDAWETAGSWVADGMVRLLCADRPLAERLLQQSVIHIVPLTSPYSATQAHGSYTTLDGEGIYGAATWSDAVPPPEFAITRREVTQAIARKKLGCLLTIHSWQAQSENTGLETIRTSSGNELVGARYEWASRTLETLIRNVPHGSARFPERIWHPGLARDHLLAEYNAITFRVEITTFAQGYEGFRETARAFLENLGDVADWRPVCQP